MNILVLPDVFLPDHAGGISKSLLPEVVELAARGHRIVVVARRLEQGLPHYETRGIYELYRYPSPAKGTVFYRLYPLFNISQVRRLCPQLHKEFQFDVAYIHNPFQAIGFLQAFKQMPYVYVFHAPIPREIEIEAEKGKYGIATPLVKLVNRWIKAKESHALNRAKKIIVRSEFMENEMFRLYGDVGKEGVVRIPLCVDTQRFSFIENPNPIREKLGLPLDRPILLTVRRLVARTGLENLVAAMRRVTKLVPEALLLIGGKGYLENSLRKQVKEFQLEQNVKFFGFVREEELPMYYQAADLFVLPTVALEGFGLVTIEALSCGTPVVATPVGANPEVLEPLGEEFLCRDTSPDALAERIVWFIKKGTGSKLRKLCREYCETNFRVDKVVGEIERVLQAAAEDVMCQ